jgi:hypothetical protein
MNQKKNKPEKEIVDLKASEALKWLNLEIPERKRSLTR